VKKIIALALILVLAFSLSACSGNSATPPPLSSTPGSAQSASTETPSQEPLAGVDYDISAPMSSPFYQNTIDRADRNPPFDEWRDFLTYDYDEDVYRYNGKWVRTLWDENYPNPDSYNGFSSSLTQIKGDKNYYSGNPIDLKTVRNSETYIVESLVRMIIE